MKRILAGILVSVLLLTAAGCATVIPPNGTLDLDVNAVDRIVITNGLMEGNSFTVENREQINKIVQFLNSFRLENGEPGGNDYRYALRLYDGKEDHVMHRFSIVDDSAVILDGTMYTENAKDLLRYVESLECGTLTDNELINLLFESDILEQLNVLDEEGKISIDKIVSLPSSCPALFELLKRPSAIVSVSGYGVDALSKYLNSSNPALVEKGKEWAAVIQNLLPQVKEKIEDLLATAGTGESNSEN